MTTRKTRPDSSEQAAPIPIYLEPQGLELPSPPYEYCGFDDVNSLILVVQSSRLSAYSMLQSRGKEPVWAVDLPDGPPISLVKCSPGCDTVAILRPGSRAVEFAEVATGNIFLQAPRRKNARLLGVFWAQCADCQVVLVTSAGMELYDHVRQGLVYLDTKRHVITWFKYAHETRIVILGVSASGFRVQPY